MGKFGSKKPLNGKQKSNAVPINTPPRGEDAAIVANDLDSQYLSICYLLQAESEASQNLVREDMILSRMLERLSNGTPKDIEELTLGTFASALGWVGPEVVQALLREGLIEFCHQVVLRYIERDGMNSRSSDRSCELSIDLLTDLLNLEDDVVSWLLINLDVYVRLIETTHFTHPSVVIKRCCSRLISDLVQIKPRAFVPGTPESRVTPESARSLFSLCTSSDTETSCNMLIAGLALESEFGSSVIPTVANLSLNIPQLFTSILSESATFVGSPSDEVELRLSNHRSQVRGISALFEYLCGGIEDAIGDMNDSIENQVFQIIAAKKIQNVEIEVFKKILAQQVDFESIVLLVGKFCDTLGSSLMNDRDVSNVFDMIGHLLRLVKIPSFRLKEFRSDNHQIELVKFAARILAIVEASTADLSSSNGLIGECLDIIVTALHSTYATQVPAKTALLTLLGEFFEKILKPLIRESVEILDSSVCYSEEHDKVGVACIQIIDLLFRLNKGSSQVGKFCAQSLVTALSTLSEENISVEVSCALMEAVFVVFGESDNDSILAQIDAKNIFESIANYLKKHTDRSENVRGTIENIHAFIEYKRNQ